MSRNERAVLAVLQRADTPLSAYQILDSDVVRASGIKAPLTVYRALGRLVDAGQVHRIESLNAFVICDHEHHNDAEPAAFMICESCRKTTEIATSGLRALLRQEAKKNDFTVERMSIEIAGRCKACRSELER